jgi:hypothetical protein
MPITALFIKFSVFPVLFKIREYGITEKDEGKIKEK